MKFYRTLQSIDLYHHQSDKWWLRPSLQGATTQFENYSSYMERLFVQIPNVDDDGEEVVASTPPPPPASEAVSPAPEVAPPTTG